MKILILSTNCVRSSIPRSALLCASLLLSCFAISPMGQAVNPPPDGAYPGANTAEGQAALLRLTTGTYNTAVGIYSLLSDTTGKFNTGIGAAALLANTGDQNTATGAGALFSHADGVGNTANGAFALFSDASGIDNTAIGSSALFSNTAGHDNTASGLGALFSNTTGSENTADGENALQANTTGNINTAVGQNALFQNTTGTGDIALGVQAGANVTTANQVICIGSNGENVSNSCYIGNIFSATSGGGIAVFVNSAGRLGTSTSSRRFKQQIKPMEQASEALYALKPVSFHYKKDIDPQGIAQFGLVAEDVEKVNRDLVVRDKDGKPYSVRYDQVNAMLLNEFLKGHRQVQDLKAIVAQQQKQIEGLMAGLQKVNARLAAASLSGGGLEASKPAPQVVTNP